MDIACAVRRRLRPRTVASEDGTTDNHATLDHVCLGVHLRVCGPGPGGRPDLRGHGDPQLIGEGWGPILLKALRPACYVAPVSSNTGRWCKPLGGAQLTTPKTKATVAPLAPAVMGTLAASPASLTARPAPAAPRAMAVPPAMEVPGSSKVQWHFRIEHPPYDRSGLGRRTGRRPSWNRGFASRPFHCLSVEYVEHSPSRVSVGPQLRDSTQAINPFGDLALDQLAMGSTTGRARHCCGRCANRPTRC